ncbi:MAG: kelch repeat-containing protein [Bacteroidota bacterium]|nr:kelch repeat-containing protein [Bacteroidota bacterium]
MAQLIGSSCSPTGNEKLALSWHEFPEIPPASFESVQPGLAGSIAGAHGNFLLVAGGANFEDGLPWRGGKKKYHDEIFLLEKTASGEYSWKQVPEKLPYPMAYPACVSTPEGVVSIGGEDFDSPVADVFLFSFQDGKVSRSSLPELPQAISSAGATAIGNELFVAGGLVASGASSVFYSLDMKNLAKGWRVLPEIPVAFSHAVVVNQEDENEMCIYVIGGRNKTSEVSTFLSSVWKYTPSIQKWSLEGDIISDGKPLALSAGTGIAVGLHHIVLFGGDPGIFFNRTERMNAALEKVSGEERQKLWNEKDSMLTNHPGFSKDILAFNTLSKSWEKIGEIAGDSPVTTSAFSWNGTTVIPSGEVRPGVRTPNVIGVKIQFEK